MVDVPARVTSRQQRDRAKCSRFGGSSRKYSDARRRQSRVIHEPNRPKSEPRHRAKWYGSVLVRTRTGCRRLAPGIRGDRRLGRTGYTCQVTERVRAVLRSRSIRVVGLLVIQASFGAAFAVLTARSLGPADRGVVVIMTTLGSFLMLLGSLGAATGGRMLLSQSAPDYGVRRHRDVTRLLSSAHVLSMMLVGWPLLAFTHAWRGWVVGVVFALYGVAMVAVYLMREALHGVGLHTRATFADLLMNAVLLVGFLALLKMEWLTIIGVSSLLLAAAFVEVVYLSWHLSRFKAEPMPAGARSIRDLLYLSSPALLASLGQAFTIRGDRLVLGALADAHAVGIYGTAATFAEMIWLIPMGVGQIVFRHAAQGRMEKVARLQALTLAAMLATGVIGAALAKPAVGLLLGPEYSESVPLIWILLVAAIPMGVYHLHAPVLNGTGDLRGPAIAGGVSAVVLVGICVVSIPYIGAYGAALGSFVAYCLMAVIAARRSRRLFATEGSS